MLNELYSPRVVGRPGRGTNVDFAVYLNRLVAQCSPVLLLRLSISTTNSSAASSASPSNLIVLGPPLQIFSISDIVGIFSVFSRFVREPTSSGNANVALVLVRLDRLRWFTITFMLIRRL